MKKTILVVGASRGIGASVTQHFCDAGHRVYAVSRTPALTGEWIQTDISTSEGIQVLLEQIGATPLDTLLYMGGVWEANAFTGDFNFRKSPYDESYRVISVNLIAPIEITKGLANNLAATPNPRAIYIGALSGLEQSATPEVANTASKFGLRGAIQALRLALSPEKIGFTVINPGNVATEEVLSDIQENRFPPQTPIPINDLISAIEWVMSLSQSVEVGDINLIQKHN